MNLSHYFKKITTFNAEIRYELDQIKEKNERRVALFLGNGDPFWPRYALFKTTDWMEILPWHYFSMLFCQCLLGNERWKPFKRKHV